MYFLPDRSDASKHVHRQFNSTHNYFATYAVATHRTSLLVEAALAFSRCLHVFVHVVLPSIIFMLSFHFPALTVLVHDLYKTSSRRGPLILVFDVSFLLCCPAPSVTCIFYQTGTMFLSMCIDNSIARTIILQPMPWPHIDLFGKKQSTRTISS